MKNPFFFKGYLIYSLAMTHNLSFNQVDHILCNIGGAFGVMVGFGLGNIVSVLTNFAVSVPLEWAIVGLLFCTGVGLTFGFWPAVRASKMDPIVALRWE